MFVISPQMWNSVALLQLLKIMNPVVRELAPKQERLQATISEIDKHVHMYWSRSELIGWYQFLRAVKFSCLHTSSACWYPHEWSYTALHISPAQISRRPAMKVSVSIPMILISPSWLQFWHTAGYMYTCMHARVEWKPSNVHLAVLTSECSAVEK